MMRPDALTSAESREPHSPGDGTDPPQLEAGAVRSLPPRAPAGFHDSGNDGNSSDRWPRSPRSFDDGWHRNRAGDSFRTIGPPTDSKARNPASSAPAPSSPQRESARSPPRAWFVLVRWTHDSGPVRPFRSLSSREGE